MSDTVLSLLITIGLVFLTSPFWTSAIIKTLNFGDAVAEMEAVGLPFSTLSAIATIVVQAVCSVLLVLGIVPMIAVLILAAFTIVATVLAHPFWSVTGQERDKKFNGFTANTGLLGGLVLAAFLTKVQ